MTHTDFALACELSFFIPKWWMEFVGDHVTLREWVKDASS
jgi:hypothetical protein